MTRTFWLLIVMVVTLAAGCVPQQPRSPEGAAIFRGEGVTVARPPAAWQRYDQKFKGTIVAWKEKDSQSEITIVKLPALGFRLERAAMSYLAGLRVGFKETSNGKIIRLLEKEQMKIGEYNFLRVQIGIEVSDPDVTVELKEDFYFLKERENIYIVDLLAENSSYNKDRLTFQAVLESFRVE